VFREHLPFLDPSKSRSALVPLWPFAIARMLIGVLWLYSLRWKLPPDFDGGSERGLREWLELEVEFAAFAPYGSIVENLVLPNFTFFAWALFLVELIVGLSLLTGTFTRVGALIGLALSLNLGIGLLEVPNEWPWSYVLLAMWHGVFFIIGAGQLWGVDRWRRRPGPQTITDSETDLLKDRKGLHE
jgi:thiosulfate dehydrogenase [quinone] large subunit